MTRNYNAVQDQVYVNGTGNITIGHLRIDHEDRHLEGDFNGDSLMACIHAGDKITVGTKTYTCSEDDIATDDKWTYLYDIITEAEVFIQDLVTVVQVKDGVTIVQDNYGVFEMDHRHFAGNDLIIVVTYRPDSSDVISSGMSIVKDQNGRPVLGYFNWNPKSIDIEGDSKLYLKSAIHSLLHIIGFSQERMLDFRNISTATNTSDAVESYLEPQISGRVSDYREQTLLTSPKVKELFREYFGCEDAEGAVLEDQGGADVAGSHWEMAVMMDELMTATVSSHSILSPLTLAALEDSGWYRSVDYSKAERLIFGEKKGCEFVRNRCNSSWPRGEGYFCDSQGEESCTYDRRAIGWCDLRSWAVIPEKYQYFNSSYVGGPVDYADFCPYTYPTFYCDQSASSEPSEHGDEASSVSRCFQSSLTNSLEDGILKQKPLCYPHHCYSETEYAVQVGDYWYPCPSGKTLGTVIGYNGTIQCANASLFCTKSSVDKKFPVFTKIEPTSAEPGATVRIYGRNLGADTIVTLGIACEDVTYEPKNNSISCVIKKYSELSIVAGKKNIILKQGDFRLAIPNAFELQSNLSSWLVTNWFLAVCIGLAALVIILTIILVTCKCCTTNRKWKKYQKQQKAAAQRQNQAAQNAAASRNEFGGDVEMDTVA